MLKPPLRILLVAGLCIVLLVAMVVREGMVRAAGTEVQMAMAGVDPRSLLSGNYVTVSLSEALPEGATCPPNTSFASTQDIQAEAARKWVSLRSDGSLGHAVDRAPTRDAALHQAPLAARGTMRCDDPSPGFFGIGATHARITTDLGIERFFVSQAQADRINELLRHADRNAPSPVNAILSIGQDGRARLKGIAVKGERLELTWL